MLRVVEHGRRSALRVTGSGARSWVFHVELDRDPPPMFLCSHGTSVRVSQFLCFGPPARIGGLQSARVIVKCRLVSNPESASGPHTRPPYQKNARRRPLLTTFIGTQ